MCGIRMPFVSPVSFRVRRKVELLEVGKEETLRRSSDSAWTFLTNHAHVLLCIAQDPRTRMRDLAQTVGITERAVQRIVAELEEAGYLSRARHGRTNRYTVHKDLPLRHPVERHCQVFSLIRMIQRPLSRIA